MKYFVRETQADHGVINTAGIKARDDVEHILQKKGFHAIQINFANDQRVEAGWAKKLLYHLMVYKKWKKKVSQIGKGDVLFLQVPIIHHSILLSPIVKSVRKKGAQIILLVHDLESLRSSLRKDLSFTVRTRLYFEERSLLDKCDYLIVHNKQMKSRLSEMGISKTKMVVLGVFDYLLPNEYLQNNMYAKTAPAAPVVIAGNLRKHKAGYVYRLPQNMEFNLYGVGYEGEENDHVHYFGAFPPDDLCRNLQGSFGLVWDGDSCDTCNGVYGEYLKINNPHKLSLYLSSGMPVIIWRQSALSEFVTKHKCGIAVDSLEDISRITGPLEKEEYEEMVENAKRIGRRLRSGKYLKRAISKTDR